MGPAARGWHGIGPIVPRRAAAAGLAALALLAPGSGRQAASPAAAVRGLLPQACGPRRAVEPAASAPPAVPPRSAPLPLRGAWVAAFAGGTGAPGPVYVSAGPGFALADSLFVRSPGSPAWTPLAAPSQLDGQLDQLVSTSDGVLAGADGQRVWVRGAGGAWHSWTLPNVLAMGALPGGTILTVAYDPSPPNHAYLYEGTAADPLARRTDLSVAAPTGAAIAVEGGSAFVALGAPGTGLAVLRASAGAAPAALPPGPPAASGAVLGLAAAPDGALALLSSTGLFALPAGARAWRRVPEPPGAGQAVADAGGELYLTAGPPGAGADTLWRIPAAAVLGTGTAAARPAWRRLATPPGWLGPLWPAANGLWVGASAGPLFAGPSGPPTPEVGGLPAPVSVVASAAWRPARVAAGWSGALFSSADAGRTWRLATPPDPPSSGITSLAWTPDGGCLVVAFQGAPPAGTPVVFASGDGGAAWTRWPMPPGQDTAPVEWPTGSGVWWTVAGGPHPALERWAPGGGAWTAVPLPAAVAGPRDVAPGPGGLWLSDRRGRLWLLRWPPRTVAERLRGRPAPAQPEAAPEPGGTGATWIAADPYDPSVVYTGTRRSTDGGRTWSAVPLPAYAPLDPARAAFGPGVPGLAAAAAAGLERDAGSDWRAVWTPPSPVAGEAVTGVAPAGPGRFYVAVQRLGLIEVALPAPEWNPPAAFAPGRWTAVPGAGRPAGYGSAEAAAPSDPSLVYRVDSFGRVEVSRDGGATFTAVGRAEAGGRGCCAPAGDAAGPTPVPTALAVSPADPRMLLLGLGMSGAASPPPPLGLWMSSDGGRTWSATGLPAGDAVFGAAVAPSGAFYAIAAAQAEAAGGRLYRSRDGGRTWTALGFPSGPLDAVAAPSPGVVLAGGSGVVWRSRDGGATFAALPVALPQWSPVRPTLTGPAVEAVGETGQGDVFAGGAPGLAVRTPDGAWHGADEAIGDPPILPGGLMPAPGGGLAARTGDGLYVLAPGEAATAAP